MTALRTEQAPSKYFKFVFCDGLEALAVNNHKTPFPPHFHPTFNITLVYAGTFRTRLDDRLLLAPSGTILVTNPHEIHANPFQREEPVSFFTFYVSQSYLQYCNGCRSLLFDQNAIDDPALFEDLHVLSFNLNRHHGNSKPEDGLRSVLSELAARYGSLHPQTTGKERKLFRELLAGDSIERFSLVQTAKKLGIDKYKLIRLFKSETGMTPNNYFIYNRIEKSKALLAEGRDLLSVAVELGFYDAAHYCNHFRKFTGVSPRSYASGAW